ncbi:hypothetical protein A6R68_03430 [Neotoma lepida]|uniref:Uncharacterized protein n=1 Tax=Neotoma lepida TaxID=56216 RepID=A0A1A6GQ81_NEOLE|nr:hypothetical protein A6R68_03430 [Neotoma lepida]
MHPHPQIPWITSLVKEYFLNLFWLPTTYTSKLYFVLYARLLPI